MFSEYLLPAATDSPNVECHHMETPSPLNPLGIKGAGEGGTIPGIATLVSAVENALEPFGVRIAEAPITPAADRRAAGRGRARARALATSRLRPACRWLAAGPRHA